MVWPTKLSKKTIDQAASTMRPGDPTASMATADPNVLYGNHVQPNRLHDKQSPNDLHENRWSDHLPQLSVLTTTDEQAERHRRCQTPCSVASMIPILPIVRPRGLRPATPPPRDDGHHLDYPPAATAAATSVSHTCPPNAIGFEQLLKLGYDGFGSAPSCQHLRHRRILLVDVVRINNSSCLQFTLVSPKQISTSSHRLPRNSSKPKPSFLTTRSRD